MDDAVIVGASRTPIGKFLGALKDVPATKLGAIVVAEVLRRARVEPGQVDEVIMGNVLSAGLGQAPARQAAIGAGIPVEAGAVTINKVCGSGLKAVMLGAQAVALGEMEIVVAGGMESMSRAPHLFRESREGTRSGPVTLADSMIFDGLTDPFEGLSMGMTGEIVAEKYGISRDAQDRFALESHRKAITAIRAGKFQAETVAVPRNGREPFAVDEGPREDTSLEKLVGLKPAFKEGGTVTAGNAPGTNDGAAAVVLTSARKAQALGLRPMARIVGSAVSGIDPVLLMMAPEVAIRKVLKKTGVSLDQMDLIEINEAFSAQICALIQELHLDPARLNVHGGAVALGHPIGASGARILVTLLHALADRGGRYGLASLCMGGGNGLAMIVERIT
ncbi:MAG: acetyl-CoA C-acetyltransferase [Candidatus Rokubacteria bacterium]|nr:acetyl-CoA C-acetyltransferase [Candidatus Rokubacteria bacterium]